MKLVRLEKQPKKSNFVIFTAEKNLTVKNSKGEEIEIQSSRSIRVYTVVEDQEVLIIDEKQLTAMEIEGKVVEGLYWL